LATWAAGFFDHFPVKTLRKATVKEFDGSGYGD
jgi:hypothetical protein